MSKLYLNRCAMVTISHAEAMCRVATLVLCQERLLVTVQRN